MNSLLADTYRQMDKVRPEMLPTVIGILSTLLARAQHLNVMAAQAPVKGETEGFLTVPEVAQQLHVSTYRAYELCRQQKVKSVKLGKSVRVTPSAVAEYLATQGG
jgi:excisionase family DNA binding protein